MEHPLRFWGDAIENGFAPRHYYIGRTSVIERCSNNVFSASDVIIFEPRIKRSIFNGIHVAKVGVKMRIVGYGRVSTVAQNPSGQIAELRQHGADTVYVEKVSGSEKPRPDSR